MKIVLMVLLFLMISITVLAPPAVGQSRPSYGEKWALALVITRWNDDCDDAARAWWMNGMIDAWHDDITDTRSTPSGHDTRAWNDDGTYLNGNRVDSEYVDSELQPFGNDDTDDNADGGDAVFIGMHGSHQGDSERYWGYVRVNESGEGNCAAWQGGMEFGDYDAEFIHFLSCHSMCRRNWWHDPPSAYAEWFDSFDGVHQINGFHGSTNDCLFHSSRYRDFSDDSFNSMGIATAWIDNQYSSGDIWSSYNDHCPVSFAVGASESDVETRIANEQYDWVYTDPEDPDWMCVIWVGLCNPSGENTLPSK